MTLGTQPLPDAIDDFRHEAMFYAGLDGFTAGTSAFIRAGVDAGEPVLVVVSAEKIERLRDELGADAAAVHFADMAGVGANPARIIPAWREFVNINADNPRPFRGVGEPIWAARTADELVECQRHESLLNVAFADSTAWWLLCPYDTTSLSPAVLDEAERSHPYVAHGELRRESDRYRGLDASAAPFDVPLPAPPPAHTDQPFGAGDLSDLRPLTLAHALHHGLDDVRAHDLVVAVNEVATNSLRYGGGSGVLRTWASAEAVVCEVADAGRLTAPLADRTLPDENRNGGRGLWLANQLCDLVQIRTFDNGTVVRLHMWRG
ncbi:MAG: sensor histidine kinase [Frankia sp.]|nr:sensor histidine kinase [Frankia sp.]